MVVKRVILDTNMLMVPGSLGVDIFAELDRIMMHPFEVVVLQSSLDELAALAEEGKVVDRKAAKLALQLVQRKPLKIAQGSSALYVDDQIVEMAGKDVLVATVDSALKARVRRKGASVITLKQKKYLVEVA
ncbi:MAG: PIN domain-containing protein [Nanoarchaeota archaeon]